MLWGPQTFGSLNPMKPTGTATAKLLWNIWIKIRKHLGQHWTYSKTLSETSRALPLSPWTWQSIFALDTCNSMPASDELLLQLGRFQNAWHPAWISWRDWKWKHVCLLHCAWKRQTKINPKTPNRYRTYGSTSDGVLAYCFILSTLPLLS